MPRRLSPFLSAGVDLRVVRQQSALFLPAVQR